MTGKEKLVDHFGQLKDYIGKKRIIKWMDKLAGTPDNMDWEMEVNLKSIGRFNVFKVTVTFNHHLDQPQKIILT